MATAPCQQRPPVDICERIPNKCATPIPRNRMVPNHSTKNPLRIAIAAINTPPNTHTIANAHFPSFKPVASRG